MSHDHQVDAVHMAMAATEPACTHPELAILPTLFAHPGELGYQCTACKKKVVIPTSTLMQRGFNDENITGIIGLAFGEKWQQQLSHKK